MPCKNKLDRKVYQHQWYLENRKRTLEKERIKYQENREKICKKRKLRRDNIRKNNPEKHKQQLDYLKKWRIENREDQSLKNKTAERKYKMYISSAKRRNHNFTLTFEEFKILFESDCKYCGKENANGVDRVNNQIGYIFNNCVSCCDMCNKMKWRHNDKIFLEHIRKIYQFNSI